MTIRRPLAVTFDCWNTLLREEDWHEAHRRRVRALLDAARESDARIEWDAAAEAFDRSWHAHMVAWSRGVATGAQEVARAAWTDLDLPENEPAIEALVGHFEEASHTSRVVPLYGARETLDRLHAAGVGLALICDTGLTPGRVVRRHLDRLGLLAPLRATIFSDEVGVPKPDPRTFRAALSALDTVAGDAVHVGDLRRTDVAGAHAMGMGTIRLRAAHDDRGPLPEADAVADSHAELLTVLGSP
jgi:putative hydrolase of the HAD superfamily